MKLSPGVLILPLLLGVIPSAEPVEAQQASTAATDPPAMTASSRSPETPELTILRSDRVSLIVEYHPRFGQAEEITSGGSQFVRFPFSEGIPVDEPSRAGHPELHSRNVALVLPMLGGSSARLLDADVEELGGIDYAPIPEVWYQDGLGQRKEYRADAEAYARASYKPEVSVELVEAGMARSIPIGTLRLNPVQVNPAARTVRRYTRMVVEVRFAGKAAGPIAQADLDLMANALLNAGAARAWATARAPRKTAAPVSSVLASGDWYRLTVTEEGMYRLNETFLRAAGVPVGNFDPRTLKVYGYGGAPLPENPLEPRPADLQELAIMVEGEADGQFNPGDYVVFYGRDVDGWEYDASGATYRHYTHPYAQDNYYWLTYGGEAGRRMVEVASDPSPPDMVADSFLDHVVVEEEKINYLGSGKQWLGQSINGPSGSFTHVIPLPDLVSGRSMVYRYTLAARSTATSILTVREAGTQLAVHSLPAGFLYQEVTGGTYQVTGSTSTVSGGTSQLTVAYSSQATGSQGWIDWIEILYPRMLWAVDGALRFRSPDSTGVVEYRLQRFGGLPMIFDVTRHDSVLRFGDVSGSYVFRSREQQGAPREYCVVTPPAWKSPAGVERIGNQDLRGYAGGADFIIVTSGEFRAAADRLRAFREQSAGGGLKTLVVDVEQIYNEFSSGVPDVTAIRDYLKFAVETWSASPQFALLLGGASYDYKGILGTRSSFVPTWQTLESRDDLGSYATDDFFAKFGAGNALSMVLGRVSCRTVGEAEAVVDKLLRYESTSARDGWKMRILFVGDDAWTPEGGEVGDRTIHSDQTETLASTAFTPDEVERKKIYLAEYPTVNSSQGRRKPSAYQDIITEINRGALIVNFAGHGNPNVWAHERIFEVGTSIPQLLNRDRLSVFFLATCNFSQFDNPKSYTGSELLMNRSEGGAIGVISATRKVFAGGNAALNQGTYRRMFTRDAFSRLVVERPATALLLYKNSSGNGSNDQKFFYMGDPTMRLQYPRRYASIDSINGEPVDSLGGVPRTTPIQLRALSRVTVSGTIRDETNQIDQNFAGTLSLSVNDATRTRTIVEFYPGRDWDYLSPGGAVFRGLNSVENGRFSATFVVPKDISYADSTSRGRIVGYLWEGSADGAAYTGLVTVGGTDSTALEDRTGPEITISLVSRAFRPGDIVPESPMLVVDLEDSNGINTSGAGIGHRIEALLNSSTETVNLTDAYVAALDDYRKGSVEFQLRDLPAGRNTLVVRAWDSYNNSSVAETFFTVASSSVLTLGDIFNYPNPFDRETQFTFRHNQTTPLDVTVRIYTVAGRVIQTLERQITDLFVRIPWDGRDWDGDLLANGVYLYKIVARTVDGSQSAEALGKLSIVR